MHLEVKGIVCRRTAVAIFELQHARFVKSDLISVLGFLSSGECSSPVLDPVIYGTCCKKLAMALNRQRLGCLKVVK